MPNHYICISLYTITYRIPLNLRTRIIEYLLRDSATFDYGQTILVITNKVSQMKNHLQPENSWMSNKLGITINDYFGTTWRSFYQIPQSKSVF